MVQHQTLQPATLTGWGWVVHMQQTIYIYIYIQTSINLREHNHTPGGTHVQKGKFKVLQNSNPLPKLTLFGGQCKYICE